MILDNPDRDERYVIRAVPLAEAQQLQRNGVVMYDFTKLTAIDTCPTWGVLRYGLHKTEVQLSHGGRAMALECGSACHDYYAALRMWTLLQEPIDNHYQVMEHGKKLFGAERWNAMLVVPQDSDRINNATLFALDALHSNGYYDDPSDRKRTMANMEVACMAYTDRFFKSDMPVVVQGDLIGVEIPFVLEVTKFGMEQWDIDPDNGRMRPRLLERHYYCGRIDGVHHYGDTKVVCENKTAGRLNEPWRMSFNISAQVTGYTIAGTEIFGEEINNAFVMGMQIPPPRDIYNGVVFEYLSRTESDRIRWCEWFFAGVERYEALVPNPTLAPRYSHSCNRYFSACMFIPYCASTRAEQRELIDNMRTDEWSPLDHLTEGNPVEGE